MPGIKVDLGFLHLDLLFLHSLETCPAQVTYRFFLNLIVEIQNQYLISRFEIFKRNKTTKNNQTLLINRGCEGTARFEKVLIFWNHLFPQKFLCVKRPNIAQKGWELIFLLNCTLTAQNYQVSVLKRNRRKLRSRQRLHSIYV